MATSTLTSKGQLTVPKEIRDELHLEAGDTIHFRARPDGVVEMVPVRQDILALFGVLKPKKRGVTVEDMNRTIRDAGSRR